MPVCVSMNVCISVCVHYVLLIYQMYLTHTGFTLRVARKTKTDTLTASFTAVCCYVFSFTRIRVISTTKSKQVLSDASFLNNG